ncbi:hypothetical protein AB434_3863 [Heyndrickxia coagulans]|uniref:Uncharacterized protein n=1 Tax=Heyndrickxia coagulans TaxID=1398 RepID=A0AAN0T5U0_HEYCO|nr:hypothetical protein SB48_HM08orf02211 [Heyndrickxia coagulans]AKN56268.1 hypothetical protein AB434_3863 [Heyndrickxia coagulans]
MYAVYDKNPPCAIRHVSIAAVQALYGCLHAHHKKFILHHYIISRQP